MDNLIHFAFNVTLAKLYANMFVATLNQRLRSRNRVNVSGIDFESENGLAKYSRRFNPIQFAASGGRGAGMNVHITTTKEMASDTLPTPMTPVEHLNAFRTARNEAYIADDLESQKMAVEFSGESNDGRSEDKYTSNTAT
jgi:hypothetical protein